MEPNKEEEAAKPDSVNHSLGLQDLYKAAFSQEYKQGTKRSKKERSM